MMQNIPECFHFSSYFLLVDKCTLFSFKDEGEEAFSVYGVAIPNTMLKRWFFTMGGGGQNGKMPMPIWSTKAIGLKSILLLLFLFLHLLHCNLK